MVTSEMTEVSSNMFVQKLQIPVSQHDAVLKEPTWLTLCLVADLFSPLFCRLKFSVHRLTLVS